MKVLQVISSLNRMSGVANVVMNYYRQLKDKVTFDFLLFEDVENSFKEEVISYGSKIYFIPKFGVKTYFSYKEQIKNFFDEHKGEYSVAHVHEILSQRIVLPIAKQNGVKTIIHGHGKYPGIKLVGLIKGMRNFFLLCGFQKNADKYVACALDTAKLMLRKAKNVVVLNNAVDVEKYRFDETSKAEVRQEFGIKQDSFVVGNIGRLSHEKNLLLALKAFKNVLDVQENSVFLFVGDGTSKNELMKESVELGISSNVIFTGARKDVSRICNALDCFVLPSFFEGLPVILVEAQSNGIPCVCSDNIPKEANLIGTIQLVSLEKDEEYWAEVVLENTNTRIDADEAIRRVTEKGFNIRKESEKLLAIYYEII